MTDISIVTPVFNTKFLLKELWTNLDGQDYRNFEWIVVNDGSEDEETLQTLNEIEESCSFARVYHLENGGAPRARNFGFSKSTGTFVKFLDADDMIAPDHLKVVSDHMDISSENQVLVTPQKIMFDDGQTRNETPLKRIDPAFFKEPFINSLHQFDFHHSGCLYHRKLSEKLSWDESLKAYQDLDYLWQAMLMRPQFEVVQETYFVNRDHNYTERITTKRSPQKWYSRVKALKKIIGQLPWQHNTRLQRAIQFRFNTLILDSFFEDRKSSSVIRKEKTMVMGSSYDFNLTYRFVKELIKKLLNR